MIWREPTQYCELDENGTQVFIDIVKHTHAHTKTGVRYCELPFGDLTEAQRASELKKWLRKVTKTSSFRWKFNNIMLAERERVENGCGKWRYSNTLSLPFYGVSIDIIETLCICERFIKLLSVIYATFVHAIITGISEFFDKIKHDVFFLAFLLRPIEIDTFKIRTNLSSRIGSNVVMAAFAYMCTRSKCSR